MSEALDKILESMRAFSDGIARCRAATFNAPDVQDAYNRLSRFRGRYLHEKQNRNLEPIEEQALRKAFEEDRFIEGMLASRQIGEHVQKTSGEKPVIRQTANSPILLSAEVSAGSYFARLVTPVRDIFEKVHYMNHLEQLGEAENRIQRALEHAQKS